MCPGGTRVTRGERVWATTAAGDTIPLDFFVPVDLDGTMARIELHPSTPPDAVVQQRTLILGINTFGDRYNLLGTDDNRLQVALEYAAEPSPVTMGFLFERDLAELAYVHVPGTTFPATAFR